VRDEETKKKDKGRNLTVQWKIGYCPDHPRRPIEIPFAVVGGLPALVISSRFINIG